MGFCQAKIFNGGGEGNEKRLVGLRQAAPQAKMPTTMVVRTGICMQTNAV